MKSFVDFLLENEEKQDKPKEEPERKSEKPEKDESKDSDDEKESDDSKEVEYEFTHIKGVYTLDDWRKGTGKVMKYISPFGPERGSKEYEISFTSQSPRNIRTWIVKFSKGFKKLKGSNKNKIESCLDVLDEAIDNFFMLDDWDNYSNVAMMSIKIEYEDDDEKKKIIKDFFDKTKLQVSRAYTVNHRDLNEYYSVSCILKSGKKKES
jgi:hypothetical protein